MVTPEELLKIIDKMIDRDMEDTLQSFDLSLIEIIVVFYYLNSHRHLRPATAFATGVCFGITLGRLEE